MPRPRKPNPKPPAKPKPNGEQRSDRGADGRFVAGNKAAVGRCTSVRMQRQHHTRALLETAEEHLPAIYDRLIECALQGQQWAV